MRCGDCRFHHDAVHPRKGRVEQCRRHAPRHENTPLETYKAELLRIVAWMATKQAGMDPDEDREGVLGLEACEIGDIERWPYADEDDWCGEFQQKRADGSVGGSE